MYTLTTAEINLATNAFNALDSDGDGILTALDFIPTFINDDDDNSNIYKNRPTHNHQSFTQTLKNASFTAIQNNINIRRLFDLFDPRAKDSVTKAEFLSSCLHIMNTFDTERIESLSQNQADKKVNELILLLHQKQAHLYLWNTLLDLTQALSNDALTGALPNPPPPNRTDSAAIMSSNKDDQINPTPPGPTNLPVIGETVHYHKIGMSKPIVAVISSIHPFSNVYDPLYTIKLIDEDREIETYSYYVQSITNNGNEIQDINNNDDIQMKNVEEEQEQEDPQHQHGQHGQLKTYISQIDSKPPMCTLTKASKHATRSLFSLMASIHQSEDPNIFYPSQFIKSKVFNEISIGKVDSPIFDVLSTFRSRTSATISFDEFQRVVQTTAQLYCNQKYVLSTNYLPSDRSLPSNDAHLIALGNIQIITHLNMLHNLIQLSLQKTPTDSSSTSSTSSTDSLFAFQMDHSSQLEMKQLFMKIDRDSDGVISWYEDYLQQSPMKNSFQEYDLARFQMCLKWFDRNNDSIITYDEWVDTFQLKGFTWISNQITIDARKYSQCNTTSPENRIEKMVINTTDSLPSYMSTDQYKTHLQVIANVWIRKQINVLYNYIFEDQPNPGNPINTEIDLIFVPNQTTTTMINDFWTFISTDTNCLPNFIVYQNKFNTKFHTGLRTRQVNYFFRLFDIDRNGELDQHEVSSVWLHYAKLRLSSLARLNLDFGPIRLQIQINEELQRRICRFVKFLKIPYDGIYPSDPQWISNTTTNMLDYLIVPGAENDTDGGISSGISNSSGGSSNSNNGSSSSSSSISNGNNHFFSSSSSYNNVIPLLERTKHDISRIFFQYDHDNDSIISVNDFTRFNSTSTTPSIHQAKINELFNHFDHNSDGKITREEMQTTLNSQCHWFLKKRPEVQERSCFKLKTKLNQLLIQLKARDEKEYLNLIHANQLGSATSQKTYVGKATQIFDEKITTLNQQVINCKPNYFFIGPYASILLNENEKSMERIHPPFDQNGHLDIIDIHSTECMEMFEKIWIQLDVNDDGIINGKDFQPSTSYTSYQINTINQMFGLFDLNSDCNITKDEMIMAMKLNMQKDMFQDELYINLSNNYILFKLKELQYFLSRQGNESKTDAAITKLLLRNNEKDEKDEKDGDGNRGTKRSRNNDDPNPNTGLIQTDHIQERQNERNISQDDLKEAIEKGDRSRHANGRLHYRYKDLVYVTSEDGVGITCFRAFRKSKALNSVENEYGKGKWWNRDQVNDFGEADVDEIYQNEDGSDLFLFPEDGDGRSGGGGGNKLQKKYSNTSFIHDNFVQSCINESIEDGDDQDGSTFDYISNVGKHNDDEGEGSTTFVKDLQNAGKRNASFTNESNDHDNRPICNAWRDFGVCKYEDKCRFAHRIASKGDFEWSENGTRIGKDNNYTGMNGGNDGGKGKDVCRKYRDTGTCKFGDDCRNSHENGGNDSGKGKDVCRNYRDTGTCNYGDECRFSHGDDGKGGGERSAKKRKTSTGTEKPQGVCYAHQRGDCDRGDACRYSHDSVKKNNMNEPICGDCGNCQYCQ